MPGPLRDIEQRAILDATGYDAGAARIVDNAAKIVAANREARESIAQLNEALGKTGGGGAGSGLAAAQEIGKINAAIREQQRILGDVTSAGREFGGVQGEIAQMVREAGGAVRDATAALGDFSAGQSEVVRVGRDTTTTLGDLAGGLERVREKSSGGGDDLLGYVSSLGLVRDTARDTTKALTDVAAASAAARSAGPGGLPLWVEQQVAAAKAPTFTAADLAALAARGGGGGGGTTDAATAAIIARNIARAGGTSSNTGNAAVGAALGALLGAGGGGGFPGGGGGGGSGGGGGFWGSFGGGALSGLFTKDTSATAQWRTAASAIATWYPRIHWAMMLTNEVLATAGPAAIAALSAGAVGLEGGQTAYSRVSAVNTVGQSIGPSLGTTPGQFLGLGDSLQKAQTAADPQVWELMGAAINSVKAATDSASGGLGNFWQLGTNTIGMMDRFGAQVTLDFKQGLGKELSGAVAGGTQDLQQFGDVLGNVGDTFLHVIPSLPGVGSDLLTVLQGATKAASDVTGFGTKTGLLGPALALEAGSRYGPALVGGLASLIARTGAGLTAAGGGVIGDVLGTVRHAATAEEAAGLTNVAEGDMIGGTGIAGALGGLGPLQIGGIAAATYLTAKGIGYQTPEQQKVAAMQSQIGTDNFTNAYSGILSGISQLAPVASQTPPGAVTQALSPVMELGNAIKHGNLVEGVNSIFHLLTDTKPPTPQSVAQSGVMKMTQQYQQLLSAGQQIASVFKVSVPEAFTLADQAGLNLSTALGPGGKLSTVSLQQVVNTQTGLMHMTGGMGSPVYSAGVNALQVSQGLAGSQLSALNSAYDQLVQNAAGGTSLATGFSGGIQALADLSLPAARALPGGKTVKDLASALGISSSAAESIAAAGGNVKSIQSVAQALTGFTSPGSQAAWAAFSSTSTSAPGVIQTVNAMLDQLRTAQTSGVLTQRQVAGAGAFEAQQLLPYAAKSPAALAQLGILSQEMGGPAYQAGESQKANLAAISGFLNKASDSAKGYTATQNQMAIGMSNVSQQAQNFSSVMSTDVANTMAGAAASMPKATAAMSAFAGSIGSKNLDTSALGTVLSTLKTAGESAQSAQLMMSDIGTLHGASKATLAAIKEQVDLVYHIGTPPKPPVLHWQSVLDPPPKTSTSHVGGTVVYTTKVDPPRLPPAPHPNPILYTTRIPPPVLPPNPHPAPIIVPEYIVRVGGGGGTGVTPTPLGGVPFARAVTQQTGGFIPGFGGGDTVPAMLEPGELVVPKTMVSAGAVDHLRGSIPGFAGGGLAGVDVPFVTGVGTMFRIAMQDTVNDLITALNGVLGQVTSGIRPAGSPPGMMQPYGGSGSGGGKPVVLQGGAIPVHVASVAPHLEGGGGSGPAVSLGGGGLALTPPAANKVFDAFEETFKKMGSPWGKLASVMLTELREGITNGRHETAKMAQALVSQVSTEITSMKGMGTPWAGLAAQIMNGMLDGIKGNKGETAAMAQAMFAQVTKEVNYMKTVAGATGAISQWGTFGTGLATPTTTAQGKNYQYYTDQQTIAGGGTVSVQQNMSDYLQAMQSFQGDIGKLSKAGINKQMLQQIIGAGPLQGDQEAQSILGGQGGVAAANKLWGQINATSKQLGITAGQDVYGYGMKNKNVKVGADVTGSAAVHSLQTAINALNGKTVTVKVKLELEGGGTMSGTPQAMTKMITNQIQAQLLKQAKRNRRTGLQLPGYGA